MASMSSLVYWFPVCVFYCFVSCKPFVDQVTHHNHLRHNRTQRERTNTFDPAEAMLVDGHDVCNQSQKADQPDDRIARIVVMAPGSVDQQFSLRKILPVVALAQRRIERLGSIGQGPLPGWKLELIPLDSRCSSTYGPIHAVELYYDKRIDAFIGPVCTYVIAPVARHAGHWKVPVLTAAGQVDNFDDKSSYPTLTRLMGSYRLVAAAMAEILANYNWETVGLLFQDNTNKSAGHSDCYFTLSAVHDAVKLKNNGTKKNLTIPVQKFVDEPNFDYHKTLLTLTKDSRIIVLCASPAKVRDIMLAAYDLGMVSSGEYVFFNIDLHSSKNSSRPWYDPGDTEERNDRARLAFDAVLTVTALVPDTDEYAQFSDEVKRIAQEEFNYTYPEDLVNPFVAAFHEAVLLYAIALNETLINGGTIRNGSEITRRMWGRTFRGINGNVSMDENGDRYADYSLLDMDPDNGTFQVVANYYGVSKLLIEVPGQSIHWAGGRTSPPPDTPLCGFDNSKCPDTTIPEYAIVSIVLSSAVVILIVTSAFIYRHYKLEAEIASMTWKIPWSEIVLTSDERGRAGAKLGSRLSISRNSLASNFSDTVNYQTNKQVFIQTGYYKGTVVAVKQIARPKVELNRPLLLELKRV